MARSKIPKVAIQNQIRALRFGRGQMTQQDLADQIGVSRQTVNAIEGGKYSPTLELAFRVAKVFDKPVEDVFRCVMTPG